MERDRHGRQETLIILLSEAAEQLVEDLVQRLADVGFQDIRPAHRWVFAYIDPGGTRLTELAWRAHMTHPSMSELVAAMVARGYLERVPDPTDGRARLIRLTSRGRRMQRRALAEIEAIEAAWLQELGPRHANGLSDALAAAVHRRRRQGRG